MPTHLRIPAARFARVMHRSFRPRRTRAWGMPGARCTRSLAWEKIEPHECRHREVHRETPGIPARNGFNGLLRDLPGDRALLSPSPANWFAGPGRADTPPRDLTPASRRQDHTTSPSAHALFVDRALGSLTGDPPCNPIARQRCRGHRILPRVRDDRDTPLSVGQDGAAYKSDLGETRSEKYLQKGLDRGNQQRRCCNKSCRRAQKSSSPMGDGQLCTSIRLPIIRATSYPA
jgi:hypothetical protein